MVTKLSACVEKELLVLVRDRAGLAILFLMPAVLVVIMVILQEPSFRTLQESKIDLLFVDRDNSDTGAALLNGLQKSQLFRISDTTGSAAQIRSMINDGRYKIALVLVPGFRDSLVSRISNLFNVTNPARSGGRLKPMPVDIIFDPTLKESVKQLVIARINEFTSKIVSTMMLRQIMQRMAPPPAGNPMQSQPGGGVDINMEDILAIREIPSQDKAVLIPNAVQHNVPAWILFAMFFIVVPLGSNMIRERQDGCLDRLLAMPLSLSAILTGKMLVYLLVSLLQTLLLLGIGIYILPLLGYPALQLGSSCPAIMITALASALAAIGYGMLVGAIFTTHQQAASFGAISVIIAAALGGIWVPVFIMPQLMQSLSQLSPMSWGLQAFHSVFLRAAGVGETGWPILKLIVFSGIMLTGAVLILRYRNR